MSKIQQVLFFLLRISLGWLFFYAGVTKLANPNWSAGGYLKGSQSLSGFYHWLASPGVLPVTNFLNEWGLTLIGAALILGIAVRLAGVLGTAMMVLYYLPILKFPHVGEHYYLVDEHIIFAVGFLLLAAFRAGRFWGLENWCSNLSFCKKYPKVRNLLG